MRIVVVGASDTGLSLI